MAHATQTSRHARWWSQMNGPDGPQKAGTVIAVLLVLGAGALVVPLPGPLLDLLLSANLAASLAVFALMLLAARPERIAGRLPRRRLGRRLSGLLLFRPDRQRHAPGLARD